MTNAPETNPENQSPPGGDASSTTQLKVRWLLNLALVVLVAGLAWVAIYKPGQQKDAPEQPFTTIKTDTLTHIRIEQANKEPIALEMTGGQWRLTAPVSARANRFNVESLLRITSAPSEVRLPAGNNHGEFGLDKPQARLWFEQNELAFGTLHPLKNLIYAQYQNSIYLIPAQQFMAVSHPYVDFIDSRLFENERKLTAFRLPGFTLTLQNGVWQQKPHNKKLTTDQINDFVSEWQNASALGVEKFSGKKEIGRIEISTTRDGKNEKIVLGILAYKPDFILHRQDEGLEYHFTEATGKRLLNISSQ
jgi:hypothetical protein